MAGVTTREFVDPLTQTRVIAIEPAPEPPPSVAAVMFEEPYRGPPPPQSVIRYVARKYRIAVSLILSETRRADVMRPRHIAMYLAWQFRPDYSRLGRIFQRDHTSVMNAVDKVGKRMAADPEYAAEVRAMQRELGGE